MIDRTFQPFPSFRHSQHKSISPRRSPPAKPGNLRSGTALYPLASVVSYRRFSKAYVAPSNFPLSGKIIRAVMVTVNCIHWTHAYSKAKTPYAVYKGLQIISLSLFACKNLWKLCEKGVWWGGSVTVYLQITVSLHKPALDEKRKYSDDLSIMPLRNSFPPGFLSFLPPPLFARHDYKPIDKVWATVLGTVQKTTC
jgi:hypothetical protein